jgi:hypothetical protein
VYSVRKVWSVASRFCAGFWAESESVTRGVTSSGSNKQTTITILTINSPPRSTLFHSIAFDPCKTAEIPSATVLAEARLQKEKT